MMLNQLAFDLREACRALRRDAGYAATVIVTLALTIGATTAVFSIVDGVLLKPLANFRLIAPAFFRTLGVPVLRGRTFTGGERDPNRPVPALISERTASRLWPAQDTLARQ